MTYFFHKEYKDDIALPSGAKLSASDPLPSELSKPSSALFKETADFFTPAILESYKLANVEVISVNVTGFRHGSIIADYIVALRSLTQMSEAEIRVQVKKKIDELKSSNAELTNKFKWGRVLVVSASSVPTVAGSNTTPAPASSNSAGSSKLLETSRLYCAIILITIISSGRI